MILIKKQLKKIIKIFINILFVFFIFIGCATTTIQFTNKQIKQIKKGEMTKTEIKKIFGEPYGKSETSNKTVWTYLNEQTQKTNPILIGSNVSQEKLNIEFDKKGIVVDYYKTENNQ